MVSESAAGVQRRHHGKHLEMHAYHAPQTGNTKKKVLNFPKCQLVLSASLQVAYQVRCNHVSVKRNRLSLHGYCGDAEYEIKSRVDPDQSALFATLKMWNSVD